ncbi:MAG TPA: hypothetical protein VLN09_02375, partial [Psychrobacter sp.]|nr:hypothetical protein [Psychrobacter sp.]
PASLVQSAYSIQVNCSLITLHAVWMMGKLSYYRSFFTDKGALLEQNARSEVFNQMWVMADSSSFLANNDALIAYNKDSRDIGKETNAPTQITVEKVDVNIDGGKMIGNVNNTVRDFIPPTV